MSQSYSLDSSKFKNVEAYLSKFNCVCSMKILGKRNHVKEIFEIPIKNLNSKIEKLVDKYPY